MTNHDFDILARTIYGEARGEFSQHGLAALIAIANVVMNRLKCGGKYGQTITEICLKHRQFSCWNEGDPNRILIQHPDIEEDAIFKLCQQIASNVVAGTWPDLTRESDHYHALSCRPSWARKDKVKLRLGGHIFYKLK